MKKFSERLEVPASFNFIARATRESTIPSHYNFQNTCFTSLCSQESQSYYNRKKSCTSYENEYRVFAPIIKIHMGLTQERSCCFIRNSKEYGHLNPFHHIHHVGRQENLALPRVLASYSSLKIGTISGFICAIYTIAHLPGIKQ